MGLRPAINPTIYSSKFLFISRDNVTAASLGPHSSDYVLGDFPRPGTELGLPQILVQLAGSRPYSVPGRNKAMTRSRKNARQIHSKSGRYDKASPDNGEAPYIEKFLTAGLA